MPCTDLNVVFLPGLGADERLFALQREVFPDLFVPPWLPPSPGEGLAQYAVRLAQAVPAARPLVLGGSSLGGMLAYEMARTLKPDVLVLMSSATGRREIPLSLRGLSGMARVVPVSGFRLAQLVAPAAVRIFVRGGIERRRLLADMFRGNSPTFLRWACAAVGDWNPQPLSGVQIYVIHGTKDRMLPFGRRSADVAVDGAGHLLTLTHAQEVNAFLDKIKERLGAGTDNVRPSQG